MKQIKQHNDARDFSLNFSTGMCLSEIFIVLMRVLSDRARGSRSAGHVQFLHPIRRRLNDPRATWMSTGSDSFSSRSFSEKLALVEVLPSEWLFSLVHFRALTRDSTLMQRIFPQTSNKKMVPFCIPPSFHDHGKNFTLPAAHPTKLPLWKPQDSKAN